MKKFADYTLLVISIVSLVILLVFSLYFYYCEFFGYVKGNNLLKSINFPLDTDGIFNGAFISAGIMIISFFLREKLFKT